MARLFAVAGVILAVSSLTGCASGWDTLTSKRFREKPYGTMFGGEDPMTVLRTNPAGDERARAMKRLKEPIQNGKSQEEQDEALQFLASAATADTSPWVRIAAIDALGRFQDPRVPGILTASFHNATGMPPATQPAAEPTILTAGGRQMTTNRERFGLQGPQGFPADQVMAIRGRAIESLAKTGTPEAVTFLTQVASGQFDLVNDDPSARDFVHQRAVAELGTVRQKESVVALARVLATEHDKDITMRNLAHNGLVNLTGKNIPPDPEQWNAVVQAGVEVAPEQGKLVRAVGAVISK